MLATYLGHDAWMKYCSGTKRIHWEVKNPTACKIAAFWATFRGFELLFCILLGSRL